MILNKSEKEGDHSQYAAVNVSLKTNSILNADKFNGLSANGMNLRSGIKCAYLAQSAVNLFEDIYEEVLRYLCTGEDF